MLNQLWQRKGPISTYDKGASPFAAPPWNRPMRLLIEDEAVSDSAALSLLRALATQPEVEIYSTEGSTPYRAFAKPNQPEAERAVAMLDRGNDVWEQPFIYGLEPLQRQAAEIAESLGEPVEAIWDRMVLADLWVKDGYDSIVTEGPLMSEAWRVGIRPSAQLPATALGEVGLCLRANGNYIVIKDGKRSVSMVNSFHFAAALGFLPFYKQWLEAGFTAWHERETHEPYVLIKSFATRISRALRALDYVRVRTLSPRRDEGRQELLFFFDALLVALDGALDCLARFFHVALQIEHPRLRQASWDKDNWTTALVGLAPELEMLAGHGRPISDVASITARLRNSVHGEVLSSQIHDWDELPSIMDYGPHALIVTGEDAQAISEACARLGLEESIEQRPDSRVQPAILIEPVELGCALTRETLAYVNRVLGTAELSHLPKAPEQLDMSHELVEPEYQRNAAQLAAIPAYVDRFSDALNLDIVRGK
jgi:hypothetical protein